MPVSLEWQIEGVKEMNRDLNYISNEIKDFTIPLTKSAEMFLERIRTNFESQGALFGGWAPLRPSTIREKIRLGYPLDILVRTGLLKNNFQYQVNRDYAIVFNPTEYFGYHQSRAPRKKLPRRVMMTLMEAVKGDIIQIFRKYIYEKTKIWSSGRRD